MASLCVAFSVLTLPLSVTSPGLPPLMGVVRTPLQVHPLFIPSHVWFWPVTGVLLCLLVMVGMAVLFGRHRMRSNADHLENLVRERTANLRKSEERFRAIFNAAGDAMFFHNAGGTILDSNEKARKQYGYSHGVNAILS